MCNECILKWFLDDVVIVYKIGMLNGFCYDIVLIESLNVVYVFVILVDGLLDGYDFVNDIVCFL